MSAGFSEWSYYEGNAQLKLTQGLWIGLPVPPNLPFPGASSRSKFEPYFEFRYGKNYGVDDSEFESYWSNNYGDKVLEIKIRAYGPGTVWVVESANYKLYLDGSGCAAVDGLFGIFRPLHWELWSVPTL